ncbi:MAG TPA: toxin [Desulfotignum sp.]|nr:toxin [Desulfotignum sp.]
MNKAYASPFAVNHQYYPTDLFSSKLLQLQKTDPKGYQRIRKTIDRLLVDPSGADGKMKGVYHGRLKKYVGRRDYRIIYYWCARCLKENRRLHCGPIPNNSVIFFDIYHKKDKKKIKHQVQEPNCQ